MIVSCPSCDSKYQVADEKIAGTVLSTRCQACGSKILVDGTAPLGAAAGDEEDDVTRIMRPEDHRYLGEELAPPSGNNWMVQDGKSDARPMATDEFVQAFVAGTLSDTVTVWKKGMANWASVADVPELTSAIEHVKRRARPPTRALPTQTSKPPAPKRAAATSSAIKPSPTNVSPVVAVPKKGENPEDALDPSASSGDFYAKLLAKVGASKSKSTPPTTVAESKPAAHPLATFAPPKEPAPPRATVAESRFVNRPRATIPPPRETPSITAPRIAPTRISSVGVESPAADKSGALDPSAAPADFYAKILAKVRPPKAASEPPAHGEALLSGKGRSTLTPPTWGAIDNRVQAAAAMSPIIAPEPPRAGSPIHAQPSALADAFSPPAMATGASEPVSVNAQVGTGGTANETQAPTDPTQTSGAFATRRSSPSPPRRPEVQIPVDIQLPSIDGTLESHLPGGLSVVVPGSSRPPPPEPFADTKPEITSDTVDKPSTEVIAADSTSSLGEPRVGRRRQLSRTIWVIASSLVLVGGAAAAITYLRKASTQNSPPLVASAISVAKQPSASSAEASAAPSSAAAPAPSEGLIDADQIAQAVPGTSPRGFVGKHGADVSHNAGIAPAAQVAGKSQAVSTTPPVWANPNATVEGNDGTSKTAKAAVSAAPKSAAPAGLPFNRDAALAILGVAASQAATCKRPDGPTGSGKVLVTFDTDGRVVVANVVGEGFGGTSVARCVSALFQRVRIAPFSGDRSTVSKSFTIAP